MRERDIYIYIFLKDFISSRFIKINFSTVIHIFQRTLINKRLYKISKGRDFLQKKDVLLYITMFSSAERRHKSRLQRRLSALGHRSRLISFTLTRKKARASFVQALTRLISYLTLYVRECHSDDYEDALQPIF